MNHHSADRLSLQVIVALSLMGASLLTASAQSSGTRSFGGARIGATGGYSGGLGRGSSVISHGATGFSIYSQQGVTRVIGVPRVSRKLFLPNGRSALAIGDGRGGVSLSNAPGNHRIPGNRQRLGNDRR